MGMKLGCVATAKDYSIIRETGFDYVEFSGRNLCALDEGEYAQLRHMIGTGGPPCFGLNAYCPPEIRIAGPGFFINTVKEYARRCVTRAAELNVRVVCVGSPMSRNLPAEYDRVLAMRQTEEFFAATAQIFAEANIIVCVEALGPCYCNFINRLHEAHSIVRAVNMKNLKLVVDFYNMEHNGEADISLSPYINDIAHVHISDDAGSPKLRSFLKPEKRELHIGRLQRLYSLGYRGNVTMEIDLPAVSNAASQSLGILREAAEPN